MESSRTDTVLIPVHAESTCCLEVAKTSAFHRNDWYIHRGYPVCLPDILSELTSHMIESEAESFNHRVWITVPFLRLFAPALVLTLCQPEHS